MFALVAFGFEKKIWLETHFLDEYSLTLTAVFCDFVNAIYCIFSSFFVNCELEDDLSISGAKLAYEKYFFLQSQLKKELQIHLLHS